MKTYRVCWEIDLAASTPRDAAEKALRIHRDPDSIATVFRVAERGPGDVAFELGEFTEIDLQPAEYESSVAE